MLAMLLIVAQATVAAEPNATKWIKTDATNSSAWAVDLRADDYEESRALAFLHMASAAYCSAESINAWTCPSCKRASTDFTAKVFTDTKTKTQAFVGFTNGEKTQNIVVAFRGSQNIPNWITNLNFPKVDAYPKCTGCKVHGGFYSAWNTVKASVVAEVKRLYKEQPQAKIFVVGHSLGAALAVLCAAELGASSHSIGFPIEGVYTYGEPRVGNRAFHEFYNTGTKVSWRLTHWRDPVPHLPPSILGFYHISNEVFYDKQSSNYKICDGSGEDRSCSWKNTVALSISDHLTYLGLPLPAAC